MKYISPDERIRIANKKFGEKVEELYQKAQPPVLERIPEQINKGVVTEDTSNFLLEVCQAVTQDDIDRFITNGVQAFQKSAAAIRGVINFDPKKRRYNLVELVRKSVNPQIQLAPYEAQLIYNLNMQIAEAMSNNGNRINSDFIDRMAAYFEKGEKKENGKIVPFVPRLTSISKAIKDEFLEELYKSALLAAMENIVWSEQGTFLDGANETDIPFV